MKVHELLQLKTEQVRYGSNILAEKTRDWQLIKEFMSNRLGEIVLTPDQAKKLQRYKFIYDQLSSGKYSKSQIVNQLTKDELFGVSIQQAYEDIRCSNELFSAVINFDKQFELNNEIEIAKNARAKCLEVCDFKNAAAFAKVIKELISLKPDEEDHAGDDFEGHQVEAVFDPRLLGAPEIDMKEVLATLNAKRKVAIKIDMFDHLDFEEKINEEETAL